MDLAIASGLDQGASSVKSNILSMICLLPVLALSVACQKDKGAELPQAPQMTGQQKQDVDGDGFAGTWAVGENRWSFKSAQLEVRRSSSITDDTLESWSGTCLTVQPLEIKALSPDVEFRFSSLKCDGQDLPAVMSRLFVITSKLLYTAKPEAQKELSFELDVNAEGAKRWESVKSGGSFLDENALSLVFDAKEIRPREFDMGSHVLLKVDLREADDGPRMVLSFVSDNFDTREKVEVRLEATMERVP